MKANCCQCQSEIEVTRAQSMTPTTCDDCLSCQCPDCGGVAFWLTTRKHPKGRYVCFNLRCDWVGASPMNDLQHFGGAWECDLYRWVNTQMAMYTWHPSEIGYGYPADAGDEVFADCAYQDWLAYHAERGTE